MSYDLAVWKESRPITSREATATYHRLCDGDLDSAEPDPALERFYDELIARYPMLDDLPESEMVRSPWSCRVDISDRHAIMCMSFSRVDEVVPVVEALAAKHELVCFNPQGGPIVKYPPSLENIPHLRLQVESGKLIDAPTPLEITQALRSLSLPDNTFAILERTGLEYMQVGLQSSRELVLEYQDGALSRHFVARRAPRAKVEAAFRAYAAGESTWKDQFAWGKVDLGAV